MTYVAGEVAAAGPSMVLDWPVFERNVAAIRDDLASRGRLWRPHVKSHGSGALARYLLEHGAIGVTTATLAQAIDMTNAGVPSVLLAAPVAGASSWAAVAELQSRSELVVAIDSATHVDMLEEHRSNRAVPVVVELDLGLGRTGVRSVDKAVALALRADRSTAIEFRGFMGYEGHVFRSWPLPAKVQAAQVAMDLLSDLVAEGRRQDLAVDMVTGGGTGSLFLDIDSPMTESQAGGGVFMDETYRHDFHVSHLGTALYIDCTVITVHEPSTVVIDAGFKIFGPGRREPDPVAPSLTVEGISAHISVLESTDGCLAVGSMLRVVPGYSDAAMQAFDDVAIEIDGSIVGRFHLRSSAPEITYF